MRCKDNFSRILCKNFGETISDAPSFALSNASGRYNARGTVFSPGQGKQCGYG